MPAITTYPGTATPLRGLLPFTESERDVLFGRDRERDELYQLVTGEGFRAGLLHGESGVGKTSLLRAGLVPHLRDHGVIALYTDDLSDPVAAFGGAVTSATGLQPSAGEQPLAFLARVVAQALPGQLYLFILDGVEAALAGSDERVVQDLGDLFARVVTRSGGRARFLFCCANESIHLFNRLERRTGSLFPPQSRYQLGRFDIATAGVVLDRTLQLAGVSAQQDLGAAMAEILGRTEPILPADLQVAALAVRDLRLSGSADVHKIGTVTELERLWIGAVAAGGGSERTGLRLAAELAASGAGAMPAGMVAARAGVDPAAARPMLDAMVARGLLRTVVVSETPETCYQLAHPILASRVREVAAPARAAARRAYELLGSKAAENRRLGLREWWALRREGIAPATPYEQAVLQRTKRFWLIVAGAVAAVPILLIILIWISISGRYYLDVERGRGGTERVVVRAGRPSLSSFHWLPGSPSYGSVVADTGYTRAMIDEGAWKDIRAEEVTGSLGGDGYAEAAAGALRPQLRGLIEYATTGSAATLAQLRKTAEGPEEVAALLTALRPIAAGSAEEVTFVNQHLADSSPAVRAAAVALAQEATRRGVEAYEPVLAGQLGAAEEETRRLAFAAVQSLPPETAGRLFQRALSEGAQGEVRRELLGVMSTATTTSEPSIGTARTVLASQEATAGAREEARERLRRAFGVDPETAAATTAALAGDSNAPDDERVFALELLLQEAPPSAYPAIKESIDSARRASADRVRGAALPVYARIDPKLAAAELVAMLDDKKLITEMRVAMTLAWGEVAKTKDRAAQGALEQLIKDPSLAVRAAAGRAYGHVGRLSQGPLEKMIRVESFPVASGAAWGMAASADAGGSPGNAAGGIFQMWKRKGRERREAAKVYAAMARRHPKAVFDKLQQSLNIKDDPGLHPIGARGMCNAMAGGYKFAQDDVERMARHEDTEVRRIAVNCVSDNIKFTRTAAVVANALRRDPSVDIRTEAARVLARLAADDKGPPPAVATALTQMIDDSSRDVRVIALGALASLGANAPKEAATALVKAFDGADAGEKLALLGAARAIGAGELVQPALVDAAPPVRIGGLEVAIATGTAVGAAVSAALTDKDTSVRRAALARLAEGKGSLDQAAIDKALALASRDPDPGIADLALATFARLGAPERVDAALQAALASRSERERARAAAACIGLVDRGDPKSAVALLEPLLDDPSHDVRAAMLPALGAANAKLNSSEQLAQLLRDSEAHAMRRLTAAAAFLVLARTSAGDQAARAALDEVASGGRPMVKSTATLTLGLIKQKTDGLAFLATLVP